MSRIITEDLYERIVRALQSYADKIDSDCAQSGCYCTYPGQKYHSSWIDDLINELKRGDHED